MIDLCVMIAHVDMSYRKHGFRLLTERCFKQTAEICRHFNETITLPPVLPSRILISASPSANIPVSPRLFGELDVNRSQFWKTTQSQFFAAHQKLGRPSLPGHCIELAKNVHDSLPYMEGHRARE